MNIIKRLFGSKPQTKAAPTFTTFSINGNTAIYPSYSIFKDYDAYSQIDEIYSVISFLAETSAGINFWGYNIVSDTAMKSYSKKGYNDFTGRIERQKALQDVKDTDKLAIFLKSVTYEQKVLWYTHLMICGEIFLYKEVIDVGPNAGNVKLHLLNAQCMTLVIADYFPQSVVKYKYNDGIVDTTFDTEEIIHIKYPNPSYYNGLNWRGLSPLQVLCKRITRKKANMDTSVAQIQNGGVPGIVYEKDALDTETLNMRKDNFAQYLRNSANKGAPYFAGGEMGYINLGLSAVELGLMDLDKIDNKAIANVFKMPEQMLNNHDASTDNNMEHAEKRLYTNSIQPNVIRVRDGLINGVLPVFGTQDKQYIEEDFSVVKVLQDDVVKQTTALKEAWWLTGNQKLIGQGYPKSNDPLMDEILVPSGVMLLSDLTIQDVNVDDGENQPTNSRQSV
jgi:HK97 family phage portal protein